MTEHALPMYLVDLGFGKETLFRSGNELADAIRRGIVGEQSRIYHRARATWLPITVHPEYRRAPGRASRDFQPAAVDFHAPGGSGQRAGRAAERSGPGGLVMPQASRSWRHNLGSAFRFWDKGKH